MCKRASINVDLFLCVKELLSIYFPEQEDDLAQTIKTFQISGFPLTINHVCQLAYQYTHINNIEGFNDKAKQAG